MIALSRVGFRLRTPQTEGSTVDDERQKRVAENECIFREVNEQVTKALPNAFDAANDYMRFVCECASEECTTLMEMTRNEYEAVRASGRRFTIAPGHADSGVERVVETNERFEVVEKLELAAAVAEARNPRAA